MIDTTRELIPQIPTWPVVGPLPFVLTREGIIPGLTRMADRFRREGVFRVPLPGIPDLTFVCNARLAAEVVDDERWEKVIDPLMLRVRLLGGDGLFTAHSDEAAWGAAHRVLAPAFAGSAMERYFDAKLEVLNELLDHWQRSERPVDVVGDTIKLTLETISLAGFDHRFGTFDRPKLDPFLIALGRGGQEIVNGAFRPRLSQWYEAHRQRAFERDVGALHHLVDPVIAGRRAMPRDAWPKDLLSRMLTSADPKTGELLSDANVRYQILTFLIAGHETTAGLLALALHYVARDRALAAALRAEVDEVFAGGTPTFAAVRSLERVRCVLDETLRLHPTLPFISRGPKEDALLGGRYAVQRGQPVALLLSAIQRDPEVWPDPLRFDPDRFLPERARQRPAYAYKPFGVGRRTCLGRSFALVEATLALGMIVQRFEFDDPGPLRLALSPVPRPQAFRLGLRARRPDA
ncbi:MAG: cytochrome P450 [Sandaracinaceae bacterium]|nr:cytochrome P450 [Sandaracinaceae bacterium]